MPFPSLFPPPRRCEAAGGFFAPSPRDPCVWGGPTPPARCRAFLVGALPADVPERAETAPGWSLRLGRPGKPAAFARLSGEAYRLTVRPEGLLAEAGTEEGLFRACATLRHLLAAPGGVPCGVVEDAPSCPVRGLMLDVSRNRIYSLETLSEIVGWMARLKMNRLELYFENVYAYAAHPAVWEGCSPYTPEQLKALDALCAAHFIDLVPNQNTLGHFERWFARPEYLPFAELPQGGARTPWGSVQTKPTGLAAGLLEVRRFVAGLLDELLPNFPRATRANLGGDEVFDLAQGRSAAWANDKAGLYLDYMQAMAQAAARHGKAPDLWADMLLRHPEALARAKAMLPDARWIVWGYEATDPLAANVARLRDAGLRTMVAPGSSSWRSFCGRMSNMLANVRAAAAIPSEGLLLADWGDAGHWQPLAVTLPALVLAGSLAWTADREPLLAPAVDALCGQAGLGAFLVRLGDTYRMAKAEAGNATKLFQAYNLPLGQGPALDASALEETLAALDGLGRESAQFGDCLLAREARQALGLQRLAILRALGRPGLSAMRRALAEEMEALWLLRGPRAQLDRSLSAFLEPNLP